MNSDAHRPPRRRFWRLLRVYFRRFRITVLLALFALVCAGLYLNSVGVPDFVKRPLLENLRARGVNLEFSRLRLRWYRGFVADNVRLGGTNQLDLPRFTARSADLQLNLAALAHRRVEVAGLTLRSGLLRWQLAPTNEPSSELAITNLTGTLRFLPGDEWSLDDLRAQCSGISFTASGRITNASALGQWPIFQGRTPQPLAVIRARLRRVQDALSKINFTQPPEIRLTLGGDGHDPRSFNGSLSVSAPGALTPWGDLKNGLLLAHLDPGTVRAPVTGEITLTADHAHTKWAALRRLELKVTAAHSEATPDWIQCHLHLRSENVKSEWADADTAEVSARWTHSLTNAQPLAGEGQMTFNTLTTRRAGADAVVLNARFTSSSETSPADPALGWWTNALPFAGQLTLALTNAATTNLSLPFLGFTAHWQAPQLTLTNVQGQFSNGCLAAEAGLDILTRRLKFDSRADFDFRLLTPLLTEKSGGWLRQFTWAEPPALILAGSLTLPEWTNRQPDWRGEVQPGVVLQGAVSLTNGGFRGIRALAATSRINYSNRVWHLTDLALTRPEGTLHADLRSDEISHEFALRLRGPLDGRDFAAQMNEKGRRALGAFGFTNAPCLEAELAGNWHHPERLHARAGVAWTNFSFRAQHGDRLAASLDYTNKILQVFNPRVERGPQIVTADSICFDFAANLAYVTNGYTDTDPVAIATAIGPKVLQAIAPYQFLLPPVVRVNGIIPLKGERDADLHFDLAGGPFHWQRFNLPQVAGHVCWADQSVTLSNITAQFYGGNAAGDGRFDVQERGTTPFHFTLTVTNADLHALMADLHSRTNRLEGILAGQLVVTDANTRDWHTWNGYGDAQLQDGLIWDSPVFGVMSSVMNTFVPGIGNSRASDAHGTFVITNSVIVTHDLDIRASAMRLQYDGTVDFSTHVNARVQAELLRDTWFVGKIISTALWPVSKLFEYQVTGTLAEPRTEPVYMIPKVFLAPLHPVKALKDIFVEPSAGTNAPPVPTTTE